MIAHALKDLFTSTDSGVTNLVDSNKSENAKNQVVKIRPDKGAKDVEKSMKSASICLVCLKIEFSYLHLYGLIP